MQLEFRDMKMCVLKSKKYGMHIFKKFPWISLVMSQIQITCHLG